MAEKSWHFHTVYVRKTKSRLPFFLYRARLYYIKYLYKLTTYLSSISSPKCIPMSPSYVRYQQWSLFKLSKYRFVFSLLQIRNENSRQCIDSPAKSEDLHKKVGLWPCHNQGGNQVRYDKNYVHFTVLQKLLNLKLWSTIQELICHSMLREINFGKIWVSKMALFTISETVNFEFWQIRDLRNGSNWLKLKFRTS